MRLDLFLEVRLVLNDPGDHQPLSGPACHLNGFMDPLVGVYTPEEQQVVSCGFAIGKLREIDAMMDGCDVIEVTALVGLTDRHVVGPLIILYINWQNRR